MSSLAGTIPLNIHSLSKTFGDTKALDVASLKLLPGEVHSLLGQNGSGKSTLVKILTGVYAPEPGSSVEFWGKPVSLPIDDAGRLGIAVIHQDLGLAEDMSVADNIGIETGFDTPSWMPIRRRAERNRTLEACEGLGLDGMLDMPVSILSPAERTAVAIARARRRLGLGTRHLLFMDEPTASLGAKEASQVLELARRVARAGAGVLIVTHRLREVFDSSDRITVMRDGRNVLTIAATEVNESDIVTAMLGRELSSYYPKRAEPLSNRCILGLEQVSTDRLKGVSLDVCEGEIVGLTGLSGSGHDEILYLIAGSRPAKSGRIRLEGKNLLGSRPREMISAGVVLIPGNRQRDGGWGLGTATENMTIPRLRSFVTNGFLSRAAEIRETSHWMDKLDVRPRDPEYIFGSFSGGNMQKLILGKWLSLDPRCILLDEPTQGVDAGVKRVILERLVRAAESGASIMMASGDLEQLANVCHRVLVFHDGVVSAEMLGDELTEEALVREVHKG